MPAPVKLSQALVRPPTVGGGEREPMGVVIGGGVMLLAMAWQFLSVLCLAIGLVLLTAGVYLVQRIHKRDPLMFAVYRRFLPYRAYYPARSTPFRRR
jgi:type IV secretory pathway TrbD component